MSFLTQREVGGVGFRPAKLRWERKGKRKGSRRLLS